MSNPYEKLGYKTYHTMVVGVFEITSEMFGGDINQTLSYLLDPITQPQSDENILLAKESCRWLKDNQKPITPE